MAGWVQNNDANWRVTYTGGWCLKYVEDAFGTAHLYPDATTAWENAKLKHTDLPPAGITVPVYFALGSVPQGHIAIRLDDLTVASSTQSGTHSQGYLHPSIQDLINIYGQYNGGCTYLGWSEDLAGTTLVTFVPDPAPVIQLATEAEVRQAYLDILHREADPDGLTHYMQYTIDFVRNDLMNSQERKNLEASIAADKAAADLAAAAAIQTPVEPTPAPVVETPVVVEPPVVVPEPPVVIAPVETPAPVVTPIPVTHIPTEQPVPVTVKPTFIAAPSVWSLIIDFFVRFLKMMGNK